MFNFAHGCCLWNQFYFIVATFTNEAKTTKKKFFSNQNDDWKNTHVLVYTSQLDGHFLWNNGKKIYLHKKKAFICFHSSSFLCQSFIQPTFSCFQKVNSFLMIFSFNTLKNNEVKSGSLIQCQLLAKDRLWSLIHESSHILMFLCKTHCKI